MTDNTINSEVTMRDAAPAGGTKRFRAGDEILGRYVVENELGQGGMGVVYLCLDKVGGVKVAVKGLPPEVSHNADEMEAVRENFQLVHELHHPNIANVLTLEKDARTGDYYLVMAYARGASLKQWMRQHGGKERRAEQLNVLRQIASALDYAHNAEPRHIIHRDVKPENVMVDEHGNVAVLDFGLAAQVRSSMSRVSQAVTSRSGTPAYKSPEQWLAQPQRAPSDQYSLGVIAYQMFAGELPYDGDPDDIRHAVVFDPVPAIPGESKPVNAIFAQALAKRPQERFASCGDFVAALEGKKVAKPGGTRSRASALIGLAAALALAAGGIWWWQSGPAVAPRPPQMTNAVSHVPAVPPVAAVPAAPPVSPVDAEAERRRLEIAAETAVYALSVEMESAAQRIAGESEAVRAFFEPEIRAFEKVRKTGNDAKANRSYVTATNFFAQAKAKADALKVLVTARASCLTAKERAEAAKRSADAVGARAALALRYEEADKTLGEVAMLSEKRDFASASARAEAARGQFAALRADVIKVALDAAERHKTAERWQDCLAAAEKVLDWASDNAAAAALKQEAENHLVPTLRFVAKIDAREVPATAMFDGKPFTLPWKVNENLRTGSRVPSADVAVEYAEGGRRYLGTIKPVNVDWKGPKTYTIALTEYKGPKPGDTKTITLPGGVPMTFCWCPATTSPEWKSISGGEDYFWMGSPEDELGRSSGEKRHPVKLTKGFWIAQTPVTQRQYEAVTGTNPTKYDKGADNPVSDVTWTDCGTFCRQLAAKLDDGSRFALPTEAQWEYACRAGTTTALNNGKDLSTEGGFCPNLGEVAWYGKNSDNCKQPVKGKRGNAWNLYDMHGNVWEWCVDYYGSYGEGIQVDPTGATSGSYRVNRGGGYNNGAQDCRSAGRFGDSVGNSYYNLGFRPVRILPNQP